MLEILATWIAFYKHCIICQLSQDAFSKFFNFVCNNKDANTKEWNEFDAWGFIINIL